MSALGQKRTLSDISAMSALPPKADIGSTCQDVRFVPKADIPRRSEGRMSLFDHLVGVDDKRLRNREAECLRSLEIQNQLEPGWLLDGKIGRLCTF